MCNNIETVHLNNSCLRPSEEEFDNHEKDSKFMDSPDTNPPVLCNGSSEPCGNNNSGPGSAAGSTDETPKVKFLCSFLGSILSRPQDGKLRYVGGETRIVSVPRDISYEELMNRMKELYDCAAVLKYQQPDEDLDALVSVVNDDDVINMMEEYEKLGSNDGFTRLRIFLFSQPDLDGSTPYIDGDDRESERRYVDALNNLNDGVDFRKLQYPDSPGIGGLDDMHGAEQFFLENSLHSQRHEMTLPQYNMHQLNMPHIGPGQSQQAVTQRYSDLDGTWSPAYYSPRHPGHLDPRGMPEFPSSPSSARFRMPFGEILDKYLDRMPEEFSRHQVNHYPPYDHQAPFPENVVRVPTDKDGLPGNLFHAPNIFEGSSVSEHRRVPLHRNQSHIDQPTMVNGLPHVANLCAECPPNRESLMLNADKKSHHVIQADHRSVYNETQGHEIGWVLPHQLNSHGEDPRAPVSGSGRLSDFYVVDGHATNIPLGHGHTLDSHHVPPGYVHHRPGSEQGNDVFQDQTVAAATHLHLPPHEERVVRYGNVPYAYGADNVYPVSHGHSHGHGQALWRNSRSPMYTGPSYELASATHLVNGTVNPAYGRGTVEGLPRFSVGMDTQIPRTESLQKIFAAEGVVTPDYSYNPAMKLNQNIHLQENQRFPPDPNQPQLGVLLRASPSTSNLSPDKLASSAASDHSPDSRHNIDLNEAGKDRNIPGEGKGAIQVEKTGDERSTDGTCVKPLEENGVFAKPLEKDPSASPDAHRLSVENLSFLPDLIASVKKAALEEAEQVKAKAEENFDCEKHDSKTKPESEHANGEDIDSDTDIVTASKIEPTKAEAEAVARGLQTIKNDDLEEIRELGSGTYGSVYHGKWRGSDVAIKRIKASCFAGKPSERERLIGDFWREALILSSLHHPNVVSFYGIVRDGPDGSLATVTEFMINGSLKQFLQKKDRTIDRRKRLIIAMDAAFGMEYLHGKNIVHFDLKCENLLVNMRDPQRPVCKIGDLGLSKVKQHTLVSGGVRGTLPWMAPELLSGKSIMVNEKVDVYSFGIVMWELLTGEEPYSDMHCASIIGGIVNNSLRPQIPTWCDPEWKSLMESCWASTPEERPTFSEISQKLRSMAAAMNLK